VRKLLVLLAAVAMTVFGLVGVEGVASATTTPIALTLPQGTAFGILGASCGGIQETVSSTGFDSSSGYPTGVVDLSTSCGGSGRGGGYHSTTYRASADVTWDFTGTVVTYAVPATGSAVPGYSATDANGNQVYDSGSSAYLLLAAGFTPAPRVTAVSASQGPSSGGTAVTITGTGFTGTTLVSFGSTPVAAFTVVNDTSITTTSPAVAAGTVDVTVTGPGGTDATAVLDQFTFVAAPTVSDVSPNSGALNTTPQVTLTGTGFTGATAVTFGDKPAGFTVDSDTQITATVPLGDAVDTVSVTVTTIGGTSATGAGDVYAYTAVSVCGSGCAITSPAAVSATTGASFSFTVSTTGGVTPVLAARGKLPVGVAFADNGDGTGTLSGVPAPKGKKPPAGTYKLKVTATFSYGGVTKSVKQNLVLTVS
jgi:hypothetical protein